MSNNDSIFIAHVGLPELEIRLLASMFLLSKSRQRHYAFAGQGLSQAHVVMVNADDDASMAQGKQIQKDHSHIIAIFVGQAPPSPAFTYYLQRRLSINKVLQVLDQIALTELHITPNVSIGNNAPGSQASLERRWADEARLHNNPATPSASVLSSSVQKVLVVDDSPTVRKQIELGLLPFKVTVDLAETGEQALELISKQPEHGMYALVFLDVVLPGADGYEVCKAIKKHSHSKKAPVVMLTSKSSPFDRVRGTLAGCDAYLTKPVENKTFQGIVQKYLSASPKAESVATASNLGRATSSS